jgi:hypothetical protein
LPSPCTGKAEFPNPGDFKVVEILEAYCDNANAKIVSPFLKGGKTTPKAVKLKLLSLLYDELPASTKTVLESL